MIKPELKEQDLQTISLEIGKGKKFKLNSTYREHPGCASGLSSLDSQKERLKREIKLWEKPQQRNKDMVVIGDINIDYNKLNDNNYKLANLADEIQEWMIRNTQIQLVEENT